MLLVFRCLYYVVYNMLLILRC